MEQRADPRAVFEISICSEREGEVEGDDTTRRQS